MVQLVDSDIRTREVLGWQGVHVLHFIGSSWTGRCSPHEAAAQLFSDLPRPQQISLIAR